MAGYDDELVAEDSGENAPVAQDRPAGDDAAISDQDLSSQLGAQDLNTGDAGIDSAANDMPTSGDAEQRKGERNWLQKLLDSAREAYGVGQEAFNDPMSGAQIGTEPEPAGMPTQAGDDEEEHEPAGTPEQAKGEDDSLVAKKKEDFYDPMSGLPMGEDKTPPKDLKDMGLGELVGAAGKKVVGSAVEGVRQASTAGVGQSAGPIQPGLERLLRSYVSGDGGEPKEARKAREEQLAGAVPDQNASRTKAAALKQAQETTPDKGVSTLQGYKKDYNDLKSAAGAAFDQGDKQGAARLYNEAQTNVGSGEHVTFVPTTKGMDAHIEMPDGKVTIAPLTDDQFRELMHKRVGEFDHIAERGIVQNLQDLVQTDGLPHGHESYTGGQQGVPTPQARPAEAGQGAPALTGGAGRMQEEVNARSAGMATAGNKVPPDWKASGAPAPQEGSTLQRGGQGARTRPGTFEQTPAIVNKGGGGPPAGRPVNYMREGNMIRVLPEGSPYGPGGERAGMFHDQTGNLRRDAIAQDPRFEQKDREIKSREDMAAEREKGRREFADMKHGEKLTDQDLKAQDIQRKRDWASMQERRHNTEDERKALIAAQRSGDRMFSTLVGEAHDLRKNGRAVPPEIQQLINDGVDRYKQLSSGGAPQGGQGQGAAPAGMKWIYGTNPQTGNPGRRLVPQ